MVTDSEGYTHLLTFLGENLELFNAPNGDISVNQPVLEYFEEQLSAQVILLCGQHPGLSFEQRNRVIREVDAIVADLEQVLAEVVDKPMTREQALFITDYAGLIKNLFDTAISTMMATYRRLDAS
ncbi:DUF3802 family protein [Shewanella corallii]|uniref:DUF3802 family protein n=1 Tax=Shewanella corallii TaxID=560080 RepID=A0ABT0NA88_9GAMM|nr:DUF3802 family protein [Shewanella corallii]MCL2914767.1 DUF3802 family protein [Shewanella corallii]